MLDATKEGSMAERIISADSHVRVTQDQIKANLPTRLHEPYDAAVAKYTARMSAGAGDANARGAMMQAVGKNAAFTRPGYGDPVERLKDMDADGVDAEVLYSEVSAFRYIADLADGASEATRAFNDVLTWFAEPDPKRLVVTYQIPIHDIDAAVAEVQRVAAAGAKSLQLAVFPPEFGLPDYYDERYEPLLAAIQETGLPICCHIGLNTGLDDLARRDPTPQKGVMVTMTPLSSAEALGMWILTGVLERFPDLKLVFVEPGLGWVAWWLQTADDMVLRQGYEFPALKELPSTYFARNVSLTFIEEIDAVQHLRHRLGSENLLWSTDYPHPVTSWPNSQQVIEEQFAGVPADERELMLSANAVRVWNL
jgi:predicted TIM-barrel fold metal-dependent hydrolase